MGIIYNCTRAEKLPGTKMTTKTLNITFTNGKTGLFYRCAGSTKWPEGSILFPEIFCAKLWASHYARPRAHILGHYACPRARILGMHNDSTVFHYACPVCVPGFYTAPDIIVEKPKAFQGKCPPTFYNKILIPRL